MDDLVQFLRARLDEDDQAARAAAWDEDMAAKWRAGSTPYGGVQGAPRWYVEDAYEDAVVSRVDPQGSEDQGVAQHIARHDPARVLAEVDAKREMLRWHSSPHAVVDGYCADEGGPCTHRGGCVSPEVTVVSGGAAGSLP